MTKKETGRSMVEMIGVLAIIGVLSVGALSGYRMAMTRYKANELIDYASRVGEAAISHGYFQKTKVIPFPGDGQCSTYLNGESVPFGVSCNIFQDTTDKSVVIHFYNISKELIESIYTRVGGNGSKVLSSKATACPYAGFNHIYCRVYVRFRY